MTRYSRTTSTGQEVSCWTKGSAQNAPPMGQRYHTHCLTDTIHYLDKDMYRWGPASWYHTPLRQRKSEACWCLGISGWLTTGSVWNQHYPIVSCAHHSKSHGMFWSEEGLCMCKLTCAEFKWRCYCCAFGLHHGMALAMITCIFLVCFPVTGSFYRLEPTDFAED